MKADGGQRGAAAAPCPAPSDEAQMTEKLMRIQGMTCVHCEQSVAEALTTTSATNAVADWRAMPVEKSGQAEFEFEYGEDFAAHIESFAPDFSKVLVRYNPEGQADLNQRQLSKLRRLSDWLHTRGRTFLFELLVPPEPAQLEAVGGSRDRYDREVRPDLVVRTIGEAQKAGVEPDIWKIEGIDRRDDCLRVAQAARAGGRDRVACIVLGRGAAEERVVDWLRKAADVDGFKGFAIGRTIWWEALAQWLAGELDSSGASEQIAANYRRMVDVYQAAAAGSPGR